MANQDLHQRSFASLPHTFAFLSLVALAASGLIAPIQAAAPAGLAGSWSGGGWVSFASGNKEKARCHANYSRQSETSYTMSATCATASGKASQTATLHKVGANSFSGGFQNSEYNISGNPRQQSECQAERRRRLGIIEPEQIRLVIVATVDVEPALRSGALLAHTVQASRQ